MVYLRCKHMFRNTWFCIHHVSLIVVVQYSIFCRDILCSSGNIIITTIGIDYWCSIVAIEANEFAIC